jgi:hypothetical protein
MENLRAVAEQSDAYESEVVSKQRAAQEYTLAIQRLAQEATRPHPHPGSKPTLSGGGEAAGDDPTAAQQLRRDMANLRGLLFDSLAGKLAG